MAAKTFLQLYTDALVQCDETAGSGSATAKTIVKAGINESYAEIASVRDWKTLENTTTFSTAQGTFEYTPVTSSASVCRIRRIQDVIDEGNNRLLQEVKREAFEADYPYVNPATATNQGNPTLWFQSGYTQGRDIKIKLWQVPQSASTVRLYWYDEPLELSNDADIPRIPDQYHYGLTYLGIAKYFEYQKDPIASYYRQLHEQYKMKILQNEWGDSDEMPAMTAQLPNSAVITGKLGRVYNR